MDLEDGGDGFDGRAVSLLTHGVVELLFGGVLPAGVVGWLVVGNGEGWFVVCVGSIR